MRTISALEVRAKFGQIIDEAAAGERFVIERAGVAVAAIVPLADLEHMDPDRILERRLAALDQLRRLAERDRGRFPPFDAAAAVRESRDHDHGE